MKMEISDPHKDFRQHRVGRYKVWLLQKRLAELSAQVEASVLEARQLILWKQSYQPLAVAELTDEDRRILDHNHCVRLAEVVQKHCSVALKSVTQHKWAFPFNNPVDTTRFPDYPKVVSQPMDFSTIRARQDSGYYRDPKDWWADIMLVFSNAKRYNAPGSDCYLMAQTLQEVSEEKYDKVIAPRLAEEAASTLRDEMYLKKRRAEVVNQQVAEAMDAQCAVLFSLMAELHAAIREAKLLAVSLCEPLTLEEKQALATTIQGLPTAQLESIVAFVASRHPPSVSAAEVPPGPGGGPPSRKVQLNLGRYDPLLLRQLQHLASTCTAATRQARQGQGQQQQQPMGAVTAAAAAAAAPAQKAPQQRPQAGQLPVEPDRSATTSPYSSPSPGQPMPGGAAEGTAPAAAATAPNGPAGASAEPADAAPAPAPADQAAPQATGQPAGADATAAQQQAADQQGAASGQAGAASGGVTPAAAPAGAAPPQGPPGPPAPLPAPTSTQRNISDVVTNATASGISLRAGIKWPGLAIGSGVRPRARALLSLSSDGSATAGELLAACPPPQPVAQWATGRVSGVKRRALALETGSKRGAAQDVQLGESWQPPTGGQRPNGPSPDPAAPSGQEGSAARGGAGQTEGQRSPSLMEVDG